MNKADKKISGKRQGFLLLAMIVVVVFSSCAYRRATVKISSGLNIDMIFVEGGTFMMGCTPEQGGDCHDDELPVREVALSDFYFGKYQVTQAQWNTVMGENRNTSRFKGDNLPVENVNLEDVQEFIGRLNERTGENYRLPTEAEWEYAARGGNRSRRYKYSGSNDAGEVAWYYDNSGSTTHPVGTKKANELGIYDMSGNVWEWASDWYGSYGSDSQTNPIGPVYGLFRVIRGGSWNFYAIIARVSSRSVDHPGYRFYNLGFRLARNSE